MANIADSDNIPLLDAEEIVVVQNGCRRNIKVDELIKFVQHEASNSRNAFYNGTVGITDVPNATSGFWIANELGVYENFGGVENIWATGIISVNEDGNFYIKEYKTTEIVNDLNSTNEGVSLSANMGRVLSENLQELDEKTQSKYNDTSETLAGDIVKRVDQFTGENVNYRETTTWHDGSSMDDSKVDGVMFIKKGGKYYLRQYSGSINVKWFGAKGDGITDDSESLQNAINFCSTNKKTLFIPKTDRFYLLGCNQNFGDESTAMVESVKVALEMKSEMKILSNGAILKIKDGISSHSKPQPMRMFFSNNFLENIIIDGLVLDMNGQNNLISPNILQANNFTQAHIIFSGTKNGVAAGANNVVIENCEFLNNAGVTCICLAQSNKKDVNLGSFWVIKNNKFYNNGLDSSDHSSIFAWANNVECYGNLFDNPNMFKDHKGGLVAYEIHGSNQKFYNNKINNYYQGLWLSINISQPKIEKVEVYNNTANVACVFIDVYNGNLEIAPFYNIDIDFVSINNNYVTITNDEIIDDLKQFIKIGSKIHPKNIVVSDNVLKSFSTTKKTVFASFIIYPDQNNTAENIFVKNNQAINIGNGVLFYWAKNIDYKKIEISNNDFVFNYGLISDFSDVTGYGSTEGRVLELIVNGAKNITSDNSNRFITKGFNNVKPMLKINGISDIGNGAISYEVANKGSILNVNIFIVIGSTTIFEDVPFSLRINGATAIQSSIGEVLLSANLNRYKCFGIVDNTGQWLSLYKDFATTIDKNTPEQFKAGDFITTSFNIIHNGISF